MINISVKIKNYKCFDEEEQGFEKILPLNIIIGRNNSGKSSLTDLIHALIEPIDLVSNARKKRVPEIIVRQQIDEATIRKVFPENTSGGGISGNHFVFGRKWINKYATYSVANKRRESISIDPELPTNVSGFGQKIVTNLPNFFGNYTFKQIHAERKILPENDANIDVKSDGSGATNIIQNFLNKASLPSDLVELNFLAELNKIMQPDSNFRDIVVQQLEGGSWEIFLEEQNKGRIALSQSGSGLQTVLLVLIYLYLIPYHENKKLSNYFFAFEELENNIHPSLQRRLFNYLREIAINQETHFFITTHSNIVIDLFSRDSNSQILHLTHDSDCANVNIVKTYVERKGILDDLDIRASDLLQSNCIIWVEGPSDRLYFNHWIQVWTNSLIKEGNHYQCVFYGGRLLSHLSANLEDDEFQKYIQILLVNKNAILIIDSDKRYRSQSLNKTKNRIIEEMQKVEAYPWVTKGREIEHYLSPEAIANYVGKNKVKNVEQYETFSEYLNKIKKGVGTKFLENKVLFAEKIREHLIYENLKDIFDLDGQVNHVVKLIKKWNSIEE